MSILITSNFMTTCWGSIYKRNYSELHSHVPALYSWVFNVGGRPHLHFPRKVLGKLPVDFGSRDESHDSGLYYKH